MAAMVPKEYPGSFPDVEVLRRHAQEVNRLLGETVMLADKGYHGETGVVNCRVVTGANEVETRNRLIVERFFGLMKSMFIVFSVGPPCSGHLFIGQFSIFNIIKSSIFSTVSFQNHSILKDKNSSKKMSFVENIT